MVLTISTSHFLPLYLKMKLLLLISSLVSLALSQNTTGPDGLPDWRVLLNYTGNDADVVNYKVSFVIVKLVNDLRNDVQRNADILRKLAAECSASSRVQGSYPIPNPPRVPNDSNNIIHTITIDRIIREIYEIITGRRQPSERPSDSYQTPGNPAKPNLTIQEQERILRIIREYIITYLNNGNPLPNQTSTTTSTTTTAIPPPGPGTLPIDSYVLPNNRNFPSWNYPTFQFPGQAVPEEVLQGGYVLPSKRK